MPRSGGEADKLGNHYEGLWAVDAALDLVDGEYVDLTIEPVGDEAAGIEFFRRNRSAVSEYHSIKRQQADGNWTIGRLTHPNGPAGRSILGDLIQKIQAGAEGVFSSGTSASELEELIKRARASESFEDLKQRLSGNGRLSGRFSACIVPICCDERSAYTALRSLRVRTKNEPELKNDVERRVRSMFRMRNGEPVNPAAIRLLIGDFLTDNLGRELTSDSIMDSLDVHDVLLSRLAYDTTIGERIQQLNRAYLNEVNALLINQVQIDRRESVAACTALLDDGKSVMLEGTAGGGKTCVLAQVLSQLHDRDVPFLVIRLDRLTEAAMSAQAIGVNRGLPDSPTITLGEFASDRPSVLCIDQLDALSLVSARQQSAWDAFNELLDEAHAYPNMRILFACRSFDLEQDAKLRKLAADVDRVERICVDELDDDTIHSAIMASGIVAASLNQEQLRVLSVPLHLYLFVEAARSGKFDFTGKGDLFDAFWKDKARKVESRLVGQTPVWPRATAALCDAMSERESLVAPEHAMDEVRSALDAMASEAVVYIQEGFVRFFHEAFFDYSFARTFLRVNRDLVQWLLADDQHLFRRSQVRQVLTFLRDREPDRVRYLQTLSGLLEHPEIRFHIKKLVLDWLGALPDPTGEEWMVVEGLDLEPTGHRWSVVRNSVPWFDVLKDMGRWSSWLTADDEQVDRAVTLLQMPDVLNARSVVVAELVYPFRGRSDEWRDRLRRLASGGYGYSSPEMQDFAIDLIADGTLDEATPGIAMNADWWMIWYKSSTERPAFTARVLGAWFDRQLDRAAELQRDDPFSGSPEIVAYSQFSAHVIKECAAHAPRKFVRELFPRFARFDVRVPKEWIAAPSRVGNPDDQLRNALAEAMISLAQDAPAELDSIMDAERLSESNWMSALVLLAWSANPGFYAERIVRFLLDYPEQRLNIGYDISSLETDSFVAVSRTAVAAASITCSDEAFAELERAILNFTPDWEWQAGSADRTRLALLRALTPERIGEPTHGLVQELEGRFPEATERGAPEPPTDEDTIQSVGPPIAADVLRRMSDDQWLTAMAQYDSDRATVRDDRFVGGSLELSWELTTLVRKYPARFAALVDRMHSPHHPPIYFQAILTGLTRSESGRGRPGGVEQVCSVLRRIADLDVPVPGRDVALAIGTLADEGVPDDVVQMLCRLALEDPDPKEDDWQGSDDSRGPIHQAINSARGAAAGALAQLLFADGNRWASLKPTVEQLVVDRVLAVRSMAVDCLLAVLDVHRSDALTCFQRLATEAVRILGTNKVERFLRYAIFRDYPAIRSILLSMLRASQPTVVRAGARLVTLAELWLDEARNDADLLPQTGEDARMGAAKIYAEYVANETVGTECEQHLRTLFADESEAVRKEAGKCWLALEADQVARRGSLIGAYARSLASDNDMDVLLSVLQETRLPVPNEVCDLAERAVVAYGSKAASFQYSEGGAAYRLAPLMVRLYEQTSDPMFRKRVLNAMDDMIRAGFIGIDKQVDQQFDR